MSLKASRSRISLVILLLWILLITGCVLVHQLDFLLSVASNIFAICTFIPGILLLFGGIKELRQAHSIVRIPPSPTFFEYRARGTSYTTPDRGFEELRKAGGNKEKASLNRSIIEGIFLLTPGLSLAKYYLIGSRSTLPPGYWYTLLGLIGSYFYLISLPFLIFIAITFMHSTGKKMSTASENSREEIDSSNVQQ